MENSASACAQVERLLRLLTTTQSVTILPLNKRIILTAQAIPELLWDLCGGPVPALEQLQSKQALTKQFAHIIDFAMQFDEIKFFTPASQNDFAYYRRMLSTGNAAVSLVLL